MGTTGTGLGVGGISTLNSSPFLSRVSGVLPWLMDVISFPLLPNLFSRRLVFLLCFLPELAPAPCWVSPELSTWLLELETNLREA